MKGTAPMDLVHAGTDLRGFVAAPSGGGEVPFPTVMVMHSGLGLRHNLQDKLQKLNERGYLAVATDMYGVGAHDHGEEAAGAHYQALSENPALLRERTVAWFDAIAARPDVDAARMAAIGYCFGGLCVLELARSGADAKAVVSYHGILTTHAPAQENAIRAHVAAYCGANDPYAPIEDISALRKELTDAGASFELTVFGDAEHGFTDPEAAKLGRPGIGYNAIADKVSWAGTLALLEVVFGR